MMFSGIVENQGTVVEKVRRGEELTLTIRTPRLSDPLRTGESICVSGVCLTVVGQPNRNRFCVQLAPETVRQTTFHNFKVPHEVNLERALKWGERLSGHFVLGHVDGVGQILNKKVLGKGSIFEIKAPLSVRDYLVSKGSVAVDGVSLTVQAVKGKRFKVCVIPHTAAQTNLGRKGKGDEVNLEADIIAKHLARLILRKISRCVNHTVG